MQDTVQTTGSSRSTALSIAIYAALLLVIAVAAYVVFARVPDTSTRNVSVVMFAVISVLLRTVSSFSQNKTARYAVAAVVVLVFVLIRQLF